LLELEHLSEEIERPVPIKIETYGFDLGTGLPRHSDYRNLPYIWRGGFYHMDEAAVRSKLDSSTLIIGNVRETVPAFLAMFQPPPIGFVAFDMDYLVDTGRLDTFQRSSYWFLPRLFFCFDDVVGCDWQVHSEYTGELLAIREFNEMHTD